MAMNLPHAPGVPVAALAAVVVLAALQGCGPSGYADDAEQVGSSEWPVHSVCGSGNEVEGIDVSKWQGAIDWSGVAQTNVEFAIIRATHGLGTIDEYFEDNWKGAKANGIVRGVYQYFNPGEDPVQQAQLMIDMINAAGGFADGDLPAVIDVESTDGKSAATIMANVHAWINHVEAATQRRPIVYSGSYFWDDNGLDDSVSSYPLWTAHYTTGNCPLTSDSWAKWTFWQYTDSGSVTGIGGNVDRDVFDGTRAEFDQFIAASFHGTVTPDAGEPDTAVEQDASPDDGPGDEGDGAVVEPDAPASDAGVDALPPVDAQVDGAANADGGYAGPVFWGAYPESDGCGCRAAGTHPLRSRGAWLLLGAAAATLIRGARRGLGRRRERRDV